MATTIDQGFERLRLNLEITQLQAGTVSVRQTNLRDAVAKDLSVDSTFLTGSYSRNTLIAPLSDADIDVMVVLTANYFHHYNGQNGGPAGLLDYVRRALKKTYPQTPDISRNGQAVTVRFSDFNADVVPAFNRQGGGYLIPNSIDQNWLSTDPKQHVTIFAAANKANNGNLVPVIKMLKCWNREHSQLLRSFHLEVLALHVFTNVAISNYSSGVRYFFDKARSLVTATLVDPAGYGDNVGGYLNTFDKRHAVTQRLQSAYDSALRAEEYANRRDIRSATDQWRRIFSDWFPAYG